MLVSIRLPLRATTAALALAVAGAATTPARAAGLERVSVGPGGVQADGDSHLPAISADGRFVAFYSAASSLVAGDTNGVTDVFVRDLKARETTRVSVGPRGSQADAASQSPALSADGRYVAFSSGATNLVPRDFNGAYDVFVRDRETGATERVSVGRGGIQADGDSFDPMLSADGRYVVFRSSAANLVPGDTNGASDVFVHDRKTGRTTRASVGPGGAQGDKGSQGGALSADGRYVAFHSQAANLVPGDTNGAQDVFVHDRRTHGTTRVSVGSRGAQGDRDSYGWSLSADGRFVAFTSDAGNLVPGDTNGFADFFVHDRETGETERVSVGPGGVEGDGYSAGGTLSADGRHVAFESDAGNLVLGDTNGQYDVFIRNRRTGVTRRPSVGPGGVQADSYSSGAALSADGRLVAFQSDAANLVPGDTNGAIDVFVRTR